MLWNKHIINITNNILELNYRKHIDTDLRLASPEDENKNSANEAWWGILKNWCTVILHSAYLFQFGMVFTLLQSSCHVPNNYRSGCKLVRFLHSSLYKLYINFVTQTLLKRDACIINVRSGAENLSKSFQINLRNSKLYLRISSAEATALNHATMQR